MYDTITTSNLALLLPTGISLIDVREEEEYQTGHVPSARLLPLSQLESRFQELEKEQHHYIICHSGKRSDLACQLLAAKGYTVTNIAGGTLDWSENLESS